MSRRGSPRLSPRGGQTSLGTITNGTPLAGPYQLETASNGSGSVTASYDEAGNMTSLSVNRPGATCLGGTCETATYKYEWDEVGRLVRARRWDAPDDTGATAADLRYHYDAGDSRTLKTATDTAEEQSHTGYIFPSLEVRGMTFDEETSGDYHVSPETEVGYLLANGARLARLVHEPLSSEGITGDLHVFFELGDHLGSTSVALDKATSELVERSTYQAYGGAESSYRPERWGAFREDYRFTGKEEDVEVGLTYFGKRFYNPLLQRWVSADPLEVHSPGESGEPNIYSYVSGQALKNIDPLGLCGDDDGSGGCSTTEAEQETGAEGTSSDVPYGETTAEPLPTDCSGFSCVLEEGGKDDSDSNFVETTREESRWAQARSSKMKPVSGGPLGVANDELIARTPDAHQNMTMVIVGGTVKVKAPRSTSGPAQGGSLKNASGPTERAANAARSQPYPTARGVPRPTVADPKLNNIVKDLYKGANTKNPIGTGSTADAIRQEAATGRPVGGRFHRQKAQDYQRALQKWLRKNPSASAEDRRAAQTILDDLNAALGGRK